jgi:hypothetical protein
MMEYSRLRYAPRYFDDEYPYARYYEWELEGDSSFIEVSISSFHRADMKRPKEGDVLILGAYRVRVIDMLHQYRSILCVKENWLGIPRLYSAKLSRLANEFKWRLDATLEIWGLKKVKK